MSEEIIIRYSRDNMPEDTQTDWARVKAMTEEEIEAAAQSDPDNPPIDSFDFWERGVSVDGARGLTRLDIDPDTLEWFRNWGKGFTRQINAVLYSYMKAHEHTEPPSRKPAPDNPVEENQQKTPSQPSRAVE